MIKGIYLSSRKLEVQAQNFESVANNIANLNTSGYKRQLPFSEVLSKEGEVKVKQFSNFSQGELVQTDNPFDLAISGEGFFVINTDQGAEYTRNGKFSVTNEGFLVNEQGYKVMGQQGEINVFDIAGQGAKDITVNKNGEIKVNDELVDSLMIVKLQDEQSSIRLSGLNFTAADANITQVLPENYQIYQGYLEESNVNPVVEMEQMIKLSNDYESAQKMMKYLDQSLGQANEIGKI
jgi:flagellar basal-body rod protein FlgG